MIVLFMGVSGSGKTYYGEKVARYLNVEFIDADSYHSAAHIEKMRQGTPLSDEDRTPWLKTLHSLLLQKQHEGRDVILACSALKERYRKLLLANIEALIVFLHASKPFLQAQISARKNHFFPKSLLQSQLDSLEPPKKAISISVEEREEKILKELLKNLKNSMS